MWNTVLDNIKSSTTLNKFQSKIRMRHGGLCVVAQFNFRVVLQFLAKFEKISVPHKYYALSYEKNAREM